MPVFYVFLYFYSLGFVLALGDLLSDWYNNLDLKSGHRTRALKCLLAFIWPLFVVKPVLKALKSFITKLYNSIMYDKGSND